MAQPFDAQVEVNGNKMRMMGHNLYLLRCKGRLEDFVVPEGLVVPEVSEDLCMVFEVMAIGPDVGKRREWRKEQIAETPTWAKQQGIPVKIGDFVIPVVDAPRGISHCPYLEHGRIVDEMNIKAIVYPKERKEPTDE